MKLGGRRLAFVSGMVISVVFLLLAFRNLQPAQFFSSLSEIDPALLLLAALIYSLAVIVIALRWQFLLRAVKLVPLSALSRIVAIGYMGNNIYPLRAGDALRVYLLRRNHALPLLRSTTIVILERLFDGCVMLTFLLLSLLLVDLQSPEIETIATLAAPLFGFALLLAFLLAAKPNMLRSALNLTRRRLPARLGSALADASEDILIGLEGLRSPFHLAGAVVSSYLTWAIEAGVYWLALAAFGLEHSYAVALLLVGAVNLAGLIPASPGQVGIYEFFVITILTALGTNAAQATAYAVVVHLVLWLPVTAVGFILLLRQGLGWSDIRRAGEGADPAPLREGRA